MLNALRFEAAKWPNNLYKLHIYAKQNGRVCIYTPPPFCTKLTFARIDFFGPKGSWWAKKALIMLKFPLKN